MTTKELLKKLENKSAFALAWAMLWRGWVLVLGAYLALVIAIVIVAGMVSVL